MKNPNSEAVKEVMRWVALYALSFTISWFIAETLKQVAQVPETFNFKVWVFTYAIPVRQLFTFGLTLAGRYADKYLHESHKQTKGYMAGQAKAMGLLPW